MSHAQHTPALPSTSRSDARPGFTLIELLVVIAIIAILAGAALVVGTRLAEGGRKSQTENILRTLESTFDTFTADQGSLKIPSRYTDGQGIDFAIVDGRLNTSAKNARALPEPSTALYLLATREVTNVQSAVNAIPGEFMDREETVNSLRTGRLVRNVSPPVSAQGVPRAKLNEPPLMTLEVRDPWGNPIRMVHPAYHGGYGDYYTDNNGSWSSNTRAPLTVRLKNGEHQPRTLEFSRSYRPFDPTSAASQLSGKDRFVGDADEGTTASGRPYFYSPGPDRDPGARADNVYAANAPQFPPETAKAE